MSDYSCSRTLPAAGHGPDSGVVSFEPGTLIGGMYRVLGPLGGGAMGVVVLAQDEVLDRRVAIKFIHAELLNDDFRELFRKEARAMARVSHPNVLQIYAFGEHRQAPYFVMELVEGQTLEEWLATAHAPEPGEALRIVDGICQGVSAIHAAGTVHRDLKPGNVLLDAGMCPRIGDLGLATPWREQGPGKADCVGTPGYIAPEIALGSQSDPSLRSRADVYSVACIAYELFTGRAPFLADGHATLIMQHVLDDAAPPSTLRPALSSEVDAAIMRGLIKDPAERTPSIEVFRRELTAACTGIREPARILVADDNLDFSAILEAMLELEFPGVTVECVGDGLSALEAFERRRPSVAILDLHMPGMDGLELTARLRALDPSAAVPIIVLTASGGPKEWQELSSAGADRFLVKPVVLDDVVALVRGSLQKRPTSGAPRSESRAA